MTSASSILCPMCSKTFLNKSKFKEHVYLHAVERAHKCSLCSQEFHCQSKLNAHVLRKHEQIHFISKKKFKCSVCGYEMCTEKQSINHMRKHTGERPFNCTAKGCDKAFKLELLTLKNHIKYKHSTERPLKCKFRGCRYRAKTTVNLIAHKKVHSDYRPFACPHAGCSFRAKEKNHVARHERSVHSDDKTFVCSMCDHKTARADQLKSHMRRRHTTRRDFKCSHPKCEESFKSSIDLKRHFSNRHGERNVQCDEPGCGRKYANANALYKHKWEYHSKKKLACPNLNCSYSTNKPTKLEAHMVTHDDRKKISCPTKGCEYKGRNIRALEMHSRCHETLLRCPVSGCSRYAFSKDGLKNHAKRHNSVGRPFQCPLCFKHYTARDVLERHVAVHTKEKPFKCGHCDFASTAGGVKLHISSMHANLRFPFIVHPLNHRECVRCKVTLSTVEFVVHTLVHAVPVVRIERLETILS